MRINLPSQNHKIICLTGGAGQVSYSLIFQILQSSYFKKFSIVIRLIDDASYINKLNGYKSELEDSCFENLHRVEVHKEYKGFYKDADWIIFNGGFHQTKKMKKSEFVLKNARLIKDQAKKLNLSKCKDSLKVLVVANPVNTNCYLISKYARNISPKNIYGLSELDYLRSVSVLSKKLNAKINDIKNLHVWGNHSSTIYANIEQCKVANKKIPKTSHFDKWYKKVMVPFVQNRGSQIIDLKGHNSTGSAAKAVVNALINLETKSTDSAPFSMIVKSQGEYGLSSNIWFSMPCTYKNHSVEVLKNVKISTYSKKMIKISESEILSEMKLVNQNGY